MSTINRIPTILFDAGFAPFVRAPAWASLLVVSGLFAAVGLIVYKLTSNQPAIRRAKDGIKAQMLAIKLFGDEPGNIFAALLSIFGCSLRMLRYSLVPLAVMIVPFILIVAQLALRYHWRPVRIDEPVVVTAEFSASTDLAREVPVLIAPEGVTVETPPVRVPAESKVYWRVRGSLAGEHALRIRIGDHEEEKTLTVGRGFRSVNAERTRAGSWRTLLYPAEPPIPAGRAVEAVSIAYPVRDEWVGGVGAWIAWLILCSWILAFVLKPLLRVEF